MKVFLLSLLPWNRKEWSDFFADLSPLFGILFFSQSVQTVIMPLYPELYFLLAFGLFRMLCTGIYWAYSRRNSLGFETLEIPEPFFLKLIALFFYLILGAVLLVAGICVLLLLMGFNFFFYLLAEIYLSVAITSGQSANFQFWSAFQDLNQSEKYFILGIFCVILYRYIPRIKAFFTEGVYKNKSGSLAWLAIGTPPVPNKNQFQKVLLAYREWRTNKMDESIDPVSDNIVLYFFLSLGLFFGSLVLTVKFPLSGVVILFFTKAFVEMNYTRLLSVRK
ncbi:hypothetical protein LPTSP4_32410 [Leptospira ryugenii]|uniref:Uncharacterized protein n=1 Tax=Leptospira ryugenii TaxID=1917863 RepID=A0A2P2E4A6_9LEPT|nr:hypothetical protein [Leptospira ryugenii]GBF51703.1 hypothetical protein LPTSP4_32410 [Leptospira ryugenii]